MTLRVMSGRMDSGEGMTVVGFEQMCTCVWLQFNVLLAIHCLYGLMSTQASKCYNKTNKLTRYCGGSPTAIHAWRPCPL